LHNHQIALDERNTNNRLNQKEVAFVPHFASVTISTLLQPLDNVKVVRQVVHMELGLVDLIQENTASPLMVPESLSAKQDVHGQDGTPEAGSGWDNTQELDAKLLCFLVLDLEGLAKV